MTKIIAARIPGAASKLRLAASRLFAGLPPDTIALILAVGLVLGVFPVFGCPTLLCGLAAAIWRINLPAIQLINQLCAPLQIALLIPLGRLGAYIVGGPLAWSLLGTARNAIVGWLCLCVPLGLVIYIVLVFTLRRCRTSAASLTQPGCTQTQTEPQP